MTTIEGNELILQHDFTPEQRERLLPVMIRRQVRRGDELYGADEAAAELFVVCHGRFRIQAGGVVRDIGEGEVAGEGAFFARLPHGHSARALRDSEVLVLERTVYEKLVAELPSLADAFLRLAARRLQREPAMPAAVETGAHPRSIAVVSSGHGTVPAEFYARLQRILVAQGAKVIDRGAVAARFGALAPDSALVVAWLNSLERCGKTVVYFADSGMSDWTQRCIRQADQVMLVSEGVAPANGLNQIESCVAATHDAAGRRHVLLHPQRTGVVSGTRAWLDRLPADLHHHVSLEDDVDLESLGRFVTGTAIGFVAGGGGGLGPAHIGVYKAFREAGVTFDAFVGTSVGAAMVAGFSFLYEAEGLTGGTHDIFVASRSFKRPTWPRYGLLDHKVFDAALMRAYGADTMIEDCWRPFRAVATNLTTRRPEIIGRGPLWQAVRASSSIPCVLPPFIARDGTMFIDGGVMDDAPLAPMRALKSGPNVVVHFGKTGEQRFSCDYEALPGRGRLLASLVNPFASLPRAPRPLGMLFRTMLAHQRYDLPKGPGDLVLTPPSPRGANVMNFDNHLRVTDAAYEWADKLIADRDLDALPALAAILPGGVMPPVNASADAA